MASSSTSTDSIEKLNSKGYLKSLSIESHLNTSGNFYFCPENMKGLKINDFRMFTLLTGKNGIGKSKILKSIRYKLNDNHKKLVSITIDCEDNIKATLIHFDTNLIDLRGEFFMQRISTTHGEVNFFEQINKEEEQSCKTKTDLCDIRHIIRNYIKTDVQLKDFNKLLEDSSFFNFVYDMDFPYLVLEKKKEGERKYLRNLKDLTSEEFNTLFDNFKYNIDSFEGFSGFVSKENMEKVQKYILKNHAIQDAINEGKIKLFEELTFKNKTTGVKIPLLFMTSGELVLLLVLLLRYQDTENKKILLMLDEPDAFLNPSCVNDFLEVLFYLVNEKKIQIIMITHNSTTVGLVARKMKYVENKNTIILVKEENGSIIAKQQYDNFTEVFTELNSDLICVDLPYKIVFVEGIDSRMYNLYYKHTHMSKNVQLIFRPSGQEGESNRDKIIETVRRTTMPLKNLSKSPSTQLSTQPSKRHLTELSTQSSKRHLTELSTQLPTQSSKRHLTELSTRLSTQLSTQSSKRHLTELSTQLSTQPSKRPLTQLSTQLSTQPSKKFSRQPSNQSLMELSDQHLMKQIIPPLKELKIQPSTQDETKLSNLIFGIVDKDYYTDNENTKLKRGLGNNLFILERYCKENYLLDPIHIYFSILHYYNKKKMFIRMMLRRMN